MFRKILQPMEINLLEDMMNKKIIVFENKKIRRIWFDNEWYFILEDIIVALTGSNDPKQYIQKLKQRDELLSEGWVQFVRTLPIETKGGKQKVNCSNKQSIFRIIQSIPSRKAEPFKLWLAKIGSERIDEIENPELAQNRAREYYNKKGYPEDWINKRLRGIAIRQDLTGEWKDRGVKEGNEYAILTKASNGNVFKSRIPSRLEMFPSDPFGSLDDFSFKGFICLRGVPHE